MLCINDGQTDIKAPSQVGFLKNNGFLQTVATKNL